MEMNMREFLTGCAVGFLACFFLIAIPRGKEIRRCKKEIDAMKVKYEGWIDDPGLPHPIPPKEKANK
ncbi:MAG: hypothetical protein DWQ19_10145 [Crenarchaeota archaeon]|nr:MAG: hypothetical protein DWQ19_10145 [Thermoproteota archaeon]